MSFYFYLARCADGSLYTGSCTDLQARQIEHNNGKASKFTRERRPVKIIYAEQHVDLLSAMRREQQIKGWRREKKERLALGKHPTKEGDSLGYLLSIGAIPLLSPMEGV